MTQSRLRLLLPTLCILLLGACSEPTQPSLAVEPENLSFSSAGADSHLAPLARFDTRRSITIAWARKWIGPEGGRLDFQGFAIDVPPGAVDRVTQFSIHLPVDPKGSERVLARFGPHGAQFPTGVVIELPYSGTSIFGNEDARVVWWNPDAKVWEDMGGTVTSSGRLRTRTTHFSEYGTSDGRGGVLTASGG